MPEPQTMTRADVLAELGRLATEIRHLTPLIGSSITTYAGRLDAIAAWLAAACVVEGGHMWDWYDADGTLVEQSARCEMCGQRRADGTEGGR